MSIDFWMSSGNREAQNFLDLFKPYVDEMKSATPGGRKCTLFWMYPGGAPQPISEVAIQFGAVVSPTAAPCRYQVQFTPHFHVFSLPKNLNNLCSDETGRFCAPIESGDHSVTGQDVLAEDLRQLCVWHVSKVPASGLPAPACVRPT